jgi:antitoxin FitA
LPPAVSQAPISPGIRARRRRRPAVFSLSAIIDSMAQLIVRNIEPEVVEELKLRAARHGRSAEAEHRELLRSALLSAPARSIKQHLLSMPGAGTDADFKIPRPKARRVEL